MTTFIVTKRYRATRHGPRWTLSAYCLCGGALRLTSSSEAAADTAADAFARFHQGEGHGSTDAAGARAARARRETTGRIGRT